MSDEPEATEAEAEAEDEDDLADDAAVDEEPKKGPPSRKMLLILILPVLLALGGGGYFAAQMFDLFGSGGMASAAQKPPPVYYDLPEMVVNLSAAEKRAQYLKLKVSLEVENEMVVKALQPVMPRVLDVFQLYLRELRSSDLDGSAGLFRLKEELLRRVNIEIHPSRVDRVLFKEIIVQ
ncbi:MAG: flagellar basal body-associated FliL family protein [Methyloligellaceae bacterium]